MRGIRETAKEDFKFQLTEKGKLRELEREAAIREAERPASDPLEHQREKDEQLAWEAQKR